MQIWGPGMLLAKIVCYSTVRKSRKDRRFNAIQICFYKESCCLSKFFYFHKVLTNGSCAVHLLNAAERWLVTQSSLHNLSHFPGVEGSRVGWNTGTQFETLFLVGCRGLRASFKRSEVFSKYRYGSRLWRVQKQRREGATDAIPPTAPSLYFIDLSTFGLPIIFFFRAGQSPNRSDWFLRRACQTTILPALWKRPWTSALLGRCTE